MLSGLLTKVSGRSCTVQSMNCILISSPEESSMRKSTDGADCGMFEDALEDRRHSTTPTEPKTPEKDEDESEDEGSGVSHVSSNEDDH